MRGKAFDASLPMGPVLATPDEVPGDVIASGTPFGPGPLSDGDVVEVEFEGVGTLETHVATRD